MKESTTYQFIVNEGEIKEARKLLLRLGAKRFGPPDAQITTSLESITDLGRLEELIERTAEVSTWQELLAAQSA